MSKTRSIDEIQKCEIDFWKNSEHESPKADSLQNLFNKMAEAEIFHECLERHKSKLSANGRVLELGGGQGWSACVYKKMFPNSRVVTTDISEYAVASLPKWERLFQVQVDGSYVCTSDITKEESASVDLVYAFAAAHHFITHDQTLRELARILKPGGRALYLYEPVTPKIFYKLAFWRVNRKRPEVPEDVLKPVELQQMAECYGLHFEIDYFPSLKRRGAFEFLYYFVQSRLPFLQKLLPSSANLVFTKA